MGAGSVVWCDDSGTYILAQPAIPESPPDTDGTVIVHVYFHDRVQKHAELVIKRGEFCILRTRRHPTCKAIEFEQGPTTRSYTLVLAPASSSTLYPIPSLLFQPTVTCARYGSKEVMEGSSDRFTITCQYGGKSPNLVCRLVGAPVFGMTQGKTLGIVIGDSSSPRNTADPGEEPIWEDDGGYRFKLCLSATASPTKVFNMLADSGVTRGVGKRELGCKEGGDDESVGRTEAKKMKSAPADRS